MSGCARHSVADSPWADARSDSGTVGRVGTLVVGVDGTDESLEALRWAQNLAGPGDSVHAVHVSIDPVVMSVGMEFGGGLPITIPYDDIMEAGRRTLEQVLDAVDDDGVERTSEVVMSSSSAAGLIDASRDADALIVGTHERSTLDRLLLGSVAAQCAHHALCPFIAIPHSAPPLGDLIAVAFDGSDHSQAALVWAAALARRRAGRLRIIAVWEQLGWPSDSRVADPLLRDDEQALDQLRTAVAEVVADLGDPAELRPVHASRDVAGHLLDAADDAGLLVMGSRGRGGFAGLLLGSVGKRCLESSKLPIAIVRP